MTASVDENRTEGEIDIKVETEVVDVDGDGTIDAMRETTTTVVDVDGDGIPDIVQQTTTVAIDVDGDGVPDIVERTVRVAGSENERMPPLHSVRQPSVSSTLAHSAWSAVWIVRM